MGYQKSKTTNQESLAVNRHPVRTSIRNKAYALGIDLPCNCEIFDGRESTWSITNGLILIEYKDGEGYLDDIPHRVVEDGDTLYITVPLNYHLINQPSVKLYLLNKSKVKGGKNVKSSSIKRRVS